MSFICYNAKGSVAVNYRAVKMRWLYVE